MHTRQEKPSENSCQSHEPLSMQHGQASLSSVSKQSGIEDHQKLQELAGNSTRLEQAAQLQAMATDFANAQSTALQTVSSSGPAVYQLARASELIALGEMWAKDVWIDDDDEKREEVIDGVHDSTGYNSGTVFQKHDLYIRGPGPSAYQDIVRFLNEGHAIALLSFLNDEIDFDELDESIQKLAVIVCVSETGRWYKSSLADLTFFLHLIIEGEATWREIKDYYPPALKYKEDASIDYQPDPNDEQPGDFDVERPNIEEAHDLQQDLSIQEDQIPDKTTRSGKRF